MRVKRAGLVGRRLGQDDDRERQPGEQDERDDSVAEEPSADGGLAPRRQRRREVSEEKESCRAERKGTQARAGAAPEREARRHRNLRVLGRLLEVPEDGTERPRVVGGASHAARQAIRVQRIEGEDPPESRPLQEARLEARVEQGRVGRVRVRAAVTHQPSGRSSAAASSFGAGEYASRSSKTTWYRVAARSVFGTCRAYQTPKTQSPTASHAAALLQAPASARRTPARRAPKRRGRPRRAPPGASSRRRGARRRIRRQEHAVETAPPDRLRGRRRGEQEEEERRGLAVERVERRRVSDVREEEDEQRGDDCLCRDGEPAARSENPGEREEEESRVDRAQDADVEEGFARYARCTSRAAKARSVSEE